MARDPESDPNRSTPGGNLKKVRSLLVYLASAFAVTFVVNAIAVYVWNLISYGAGAFNWPATLTIAITVSIVLTLFETRKSGD